jgi:hypothetical protein
MKHPFWKEIRDVEDGASQAARVDGELAAVLEGAEAGDLLAVERTSLRRVGREISHSLMKTDERAPA